MREATNRWNDQRTRRRAQGTARIPRTTWPGAVKKRSIFLADPGKEACFYASQPGLQQPQPQLERLPQPFYQQPKEVHRNLPARFHRRISATEYPKSDPPKIISPTQPKQSRGFAKYFFLNLNQKGDPSHVSMKTEKYKNIKKDLETIIENCPKRSPKQRDQKNKSKMIPKSLPIENQDIGYENRIIDVHSGNFLIFFFLRIL